MMLKRVRTWPKRRRSRSGLAYDPEKQGDANRAGGGKHTRGVGEDTGANHLIQDEKHGSGDAYLAVFRVGDLLGMAFDGNIVTARGAAGGAFDGGFRRLSSHG